MKEIYFILTYTGTFPSKVIKLYTRKKYTHVSISLDKELEEMYSFGRLRPYNLFISGMVHEHINKGTFKRFKNTVSAVYSYKVDDKEYEEIKKIIKDMYENKEKYKFNVLGLILVSIKKRVQRDYYFYCAEFVKHVLDEANVKTNLPEIVKPMDFLEIKGINNIYTGLLRECKMQK